MGDGLLFTGWSNTKIYDKQNKRRPKGQKEEVRQKIEVKIGGKIALLGPKFMHTNGMSFYSTPTDLAKDILIRESTFTTLLRKIRMHV